MIITFAILGITIVLFVWGRFPTELVALVSLLALILFGILEVGQALAGFGDRAGGAFGDDAGMQLGQSGSLEQPLDAAALAEHIRQRLGRAPLHINGRPELIRRVGWCTGAAQSYIEAAVAQGLDAFISGEISEQTVHVARECGIHYYAAGHHATERFGVQALCAHLADKFGIEHRFIDIDNPV